MITADFLITALVVVLIPGTGVIYTIATGLFHGGRSSMVAALGCTLGIVPHLLASIFGLALILHMSAVAFQVIKYVGVAYLLYMAISMWRDTGSLTIVEGEKLEGSWRILIRGFLLNILNPKLSIFFLAFLPQFIPAHTASSVSSMLLLGVTFMFMTFIVFVLYGLIANVFSVYVVNSPTATKAIHRAFSAAFGGLAIKLAMTER